MYHRKYLPKDYLNNKLFSRSFHQLACLTLCFFFLSGCATWKLGKGGQKKIATKTIVIVGASSGFGRGVAEQLGEFNANVVLAARRTDLLEEIAGKVTTSGGNALVVTTDISNPEQVQRLADEAIKKFGKIDVWINMAGIGAIGKFWEIPLEEQARIVDINLKGFIYGSHVAIKQFRSQGYGKLINMGSIESVNPLAYHASYAATKGGILNLNQALRHELRLDGQKKIKVVNIEPWAVDTPFWRHSVNYSGHSPRMVAMDPPEKVVNATVRACLRRKNELPVGWKARSAWLSHRLFPRFTERVSANIIHNSQFKKAPEAPTTPGSVMKPMEEGRGIGDGVKKRMKEENKQRRKKQ